jgi:chorismate dehydratase
MDKIRVSTVKYANSYPLNWGLEHGPVSGYITLDYDHPAGIASKLAAGTADIGLVPVAAIPSLENPVIAGNYCIGTKGRVRTVMLLSNSTIDEISTLWLDHRSVTSVNLARVLAKHHWKRSFHWRNPGPGFDYSSIGPNEGIVIIGDQCFAMENRYKYGYDLGHEWNKFTGLPFVFACWVSAGEQSGEFMDIFNRSLEKGLSNIGKAVREMNSLGFLSDEEISEYLTQNIDYPLDQQKREAMDLFLKYVKSLNE